MYTNVNLAAPVGALAFLGTGLLLFLIGLIYSLIKKKFGLRKFLGDGESLTHFVIGQENSPLHKKTRFQI